MLVCEMLCAWFGKIHNIKFLVVDFFYLKFYNSLFFVFYLKVYNSFLFLCSVFKVHQSCLGADQPGRVITPNIMIFLVFQKVLVKMKSRKPIERQRWRTIQIRVGILRRLASWLLLLCCIFIILMWIPCHYGPCLFAFWLYNLIILNIYWLFCLLTLLYKLEYSANKENNFMDNWQL